MRIALLGTRGIPANYGGFETFAEEISTRLARRDHEVTVYCRSHYASQGSRLWRGVRLVVLPTIRTKYLETAVHTALSFLHLALRGADAIILCNGANTVLCCWSRVLGMPTVLNVDGLEHKRRKWNRAARSWLRFSERLATLCPDEVVTDARVIQHYYGERYELATSFIPYGAPTGRTTTKAKLEELGLEPDGYFLYVGRFEPENNALLVAEEFRKSACDRKLVMVGDAPYAADYIRRVKATQDPRILFTGPIYGHGYAELQSHCRAYIHATEVGGTHPALVEAMGRRCVVLYLNTPENREVASEAGLAFTDRPGSLSKRIEEVAVARPELLGSLREAALREAAERYDWNTVTDEYERLLYSLASRASRLRMRRQVQ